MTYPWLLLVDTRKAKPSRILDTYDLAPLHEIQIGHYYVARLLQGDFPEYNSQRLEKGVYLFTSDEGLDLNPAPSDASIRALAHHYVQFLRKLPLSTRSWSTHAPKTLKSRKALANRFKHLWKYAFLDPEHLKFPIVDRHGHFNVHGLLAAYKRASQYHRRKVARLAKEIARQFGLAWAQNPTSVDNPNPSTYNWNTMNGDKVVELLQEISKKLDRIPPALERIPERTAELLTPTLEKIPERTADKLQSAVFGKRFEREAESEVFTYALRLKEMPVYPPKRLETLIKAWRKDHLMDGLLFTDANKLYVIQAKVNAREWPKALEQMDRALERILQDLRRSKLQCQVVPVFAFEHVDHPGKLVANFKNLQSYEGAESPLLLLQQGVVVTREGKRIRLY